MKCILLCAGYATRLFPLTENFPKALITIEKDKPIIDYLVEQVNTLDEVDEIFVVTNDRYFQHFEQWNKKKQNSVPITIVNDHTDSNDNRLGAIGDIAYTVNQQKIDDDLLIIAGDNLFDYELIGVYDYFKEKSAPVVCVEKFTDMELIKGWAVATIDEERKITDLEEKPAQPKSDLGIWATYFYPKEVVPLFDIYLGEGNKPDSPGYFVEYLYKIMPVYCFEFKGTCFDVGTHESLARVREKYGNPE